MRIGTRPKKDPRAPLEADEGQEMITSRSWTKESLSIYIFLEAQKDAKSWAKPVEDFLHFSKCTLFLKVDGILLNHFYFYVQWLM